jgi:lipopolysaccharide export system permease protein
MLKIIDRYIIKKFLGSYFLCIALVVCIMVAFDVSEKLDNFFDNHAPFRLIVMDYYLNFIPYFVNMFSPLFTFISVIFFTSKLAENSEIIAMLSGGITVRRLMRPYMISAAVIALLSFYLGGYIIPDSNRIRLEFENQYVKKVTKSNARNIQLEVEPGVIAYIERFQDKNNKGNHFSLDKFEGKQLVSRLTANSIDYLGENRWRANSYLIRNFDGMTEHLQSGTALDTIINMQPEDFFIVKGLSEQMKIYQLKNYLDKQKNRGVEGIKNFEIEYYNRFAMPCAAFILTVIGVALSARKRKGGIGLNIGLGLLLSFSYIMFSAMTSTIASTSALSPLVATWMPNLVFALIAIYLYRKIEK